MEYRNFGGTYYIRLDRGEEIIGGVLEVCRREEIESATFGGIGGCGSAEIQTFNPEWGCFETRQLTGMLELVSLTGNIFSEEDGTLHHHTHAMLAFRDGGEHRVAGGHMKSLVVLYTAEIELRPVVGGTIRYRFDPETGTGFWLL